MNWDAFWAALTPTSIVLDISSGMVLGVVLYLLHPLEPVELKPRYAVRHSLFVLWIGALFLIPRIGVAWDDPNLLGRLWAICVLWVLFAAGSFVGFSLIAAIHERRSRS